MTSTPSLPQAVLTDAEIERIGCGSVGAATYLRATWGPTFARAIESAILSRMGGEAVPAETWIVVKEHVWEHGDGGRPTLAYLLPSEFGRQTFPSFDAASAWIKDGQWPLGFAAMKLDAPTAPAQQAAPSMWTGSRAGVESYGALEHEDRFDAEQDEPCSACGDTECGGQCMGDGRMGD